MRHPRSSIWLLAVLFIAPSPARTDDVKVQPAPGNGLVVTDSSGAQERLRVQEGGQIFIPGLAPQVPADRVLCTDTVTGKVGTCAPAPAGPPGLRWQGAWSPITAYLATDAVQFGGSAWVAIAPSMGVVPGTDPLSWDLLAQKGDKGDPGLGLAVVTACNSTAVSCGIIPCPTDFILNATCPSGYTRLSLISCSQPVSGSLNVDLFTDPVVSDRLGCRYSGIIDAFTNERLEISISCVPNFPACITP